MILMVNPDHDKLNTPCKICGKIWANHDDIEYDEHARLEMNLGES